MHLIKNHSELKKAANEKKYSKLLNNLLDIKGKDQAIFTKITENTTFDMISKFGIKPAREAIERKQFTLKLQERDLEAIISVLKTSKDYKKIIETFLKYKEKLFNTKKLQLEDPNTFQGCVQELIEKLELKIQKTNSRWKQFRRKVFDINIQDNTWPLYIATCFITIKTSKREIYAPFLLKAVAINEINRGTIKIKTIDNWIMNEKLLFLLNSDGFKISEKVPLNELTTYECVEHISSQLKMSVSVSDFLQEFPNIQTKEIKNKTIKFVPGVVMGIFKPLGGHLRKTMLSIIQNDEVNDILNIDPDKRIYHQRIYDFVQDKSDELVRIQPSNFSQDQALSSALLQDTIVWGPPGTGKSQVIANIIANILNKDQRAIVMSQKKVALDVLKKRLDKIAPFVLFILNDNKMKKSEFYKPLKHFIEIIENHWEVIEKMEKKEKLISSDQLFALKIISSNKKKNTYYPVLKLLNAFGLDFDLIKQFLKLNPNLRYSKLPKNKNEFNEWMYINSLAKLNKIEKKGFWIFKMYPSSLKHNARTAFKILSDKNIDINNLTADIQKINLKMIKDLSVVPQKLEQKYRYNSDANYLVSKLTENVLNKIKKWKDDDPTLHKRYKSFISAVKASRSLSYKFINKHIDVIKKLFPVIITTPETSFINWKKNSFDYAILDESSQMFLEIGLPIIYLGKIKIMAGDREQMKPSRWFATRDEFEDEGDIPEDAVSLLDYAFEKSVFKIMLDKNYRSSHASLMAFSARNFYKSKLEVVDVANQIAIKAIEVKNVNGEWVNRVNIKEVNIVIELTNKYLSEFEKIILLTFNSNQRQLLEKEILDNHPILFDAIEKEQIMIRNIENIQGDEANLIIISVCYDRNTKFSSTYVARSGGKNALNVAITRAMDKMIVVKSIAAHELKGGSSKDFLMFKKWLKFLDLSEEERKNYSSSEDAIHKIEESYGEVESNFELNVLNGIKKNISTTKKLKIIKQYPVGSKKIDLAFVTSNNKFILGIEIDGYRYHGGKGYEKYLADMSRQEFLEQKGYNIFRIKEIDWKISQKDVLKKIKSLLNQILNRKNANY